MFSIVKAKTNSSIITVYLMNPKAFVHFNRCNVIECTKLNWLCKHMIFRRWGGLVPTQEKKKKQPNSHSCTGFCLLPELWSLNCQKLCPFCNFLLMLAKNLRLLWQFLYVHLKALFSLFKGTLMRIWNSTDLFVFS